MKPGDKITADSGREFIVGEQVTYRGNPLCTYGGCTRRSDHPGCMGWHCAQCHAPTSMMGHDCPEKN